MKRFSLPKGRKVKIAVVALVVVLIVSVAYLAGSHYFSNPQKGQYFPVAWAPILEVGDSWTLALTNNETNYNLTITVIDKETICNVSCYAMKLFFKPESPLAKIGVSNEITWWLDTSTLHLMKMTGKVRFEGGDYTFVEEHLYTFQGKPFLTVGNEYNETDNREMSVYGSFIRWRHDETITLRRTKVEAFENVTVPVGTFSCYKIVTYDETGQSILSIKWFSMEAKTAVRTENYETGEFKIFETTELLSYSVQQHT